MIIMDNSSFTVMFSELIEVYVLSAIAVNDHFCVILNDFFLEFFLLCVVTFATVYF